MPHVTTRQPALPSERVADSAARSSASVMMMVPLTTN
jgi:hypothetical protein